jgi:hypothetical protein
MNMTTLNPSNAKYISDFFTNYVFEAASKDKLLSQLFSLPEFSQPLAQGINQFFQNSSSQNIEIDLDKLSSMNQNFDNLAPEPYENEEIPYGSEDNGSSGFLGESFDDRTAYSRKNIRTAQWYKDILINLAPIVRNKLGPLLGSISYVGPLFETFFNVIMNLVDDIVQAVDAAILEKLDPDFWKELILSYNAYDAITESKRSEMYSIEAYNQMFENNAARGYDGKLHSQGAYEVISDDTKNQFSQQVVNNPEIVQSRFQNDPNLAPRIKDKMNQYIASNNRRFVKVAQQEMSSINQQALDTLKSVTPNWDISTVIEEVHAVYQSQELSQEQKQQAINATINKYARAAQPLYKFLKENNFPTPDTAQ